LRRCTCGGIIVALLLGVSPSFKVFRSQGGATDDAHCSNQLSLALGPSPNKSLQRSVNHKVLGRGRVVSALCQAPRARVLTSQPAAAELSR
jgi:hypothetical protein